MFIGGASVTVAAGGAATAIAVGAQAPAVTGAGAAVGGVTAEGGAAGIVTVDTAEAALGPATKVETGGVTAITDTRNTATAETGATPDANLINIISFYLLIFIPHCPAYT